MRTPPDGSVSSAVSSVSNVVADMDDPFDGAADRACSGDAMARHRAAAHRGLHVAARGRRSRRARARQAGDPALRAHAAARSPPAAPAAGAASEATRPAGARLTPGWLAATVAAPLTSM